MRDILTLVDGKDIGLSLTTLPRAANVVAVQLGELEYAPTFGVDKRYFLNTDVLFPNDSFKAYLIKRLTEHRINVAEVLERFSALFATYRFQIVEEQPFPDFTTEQIISNLLTDADGAPLTDADGAPLIDGLF